MQIGRRGSGWLPLSETAIVVIGLALLLLVNLLTSTRFPVLWQDEVAFGDVASSYALGYGFTSTVWTCGTREIDAFFACNAILYPFLLGNWIKLFGFDLLVMRSLSYILISLTALFAWLAFRRLNILRTPAARLAWLVITLAGYGISLNYRSARYDSLCMLLVSLVLLSWSVPRRSWRCLAILIVSALFAPTGLQLLPYVGLMGGLLMLFTGFRYWTEILAAFVGTALGVALLFGVFLYHGVLPNLFAALAVESAPTFAAKFNPLTIRERLPKDLSLFITAAAGCALLLNQIARGAFSLRSRLTFGTVAGLGIPVAMFLVGRFPTYYSWMAFAPLAMGICAVLFESEVRPSRIAIALASGALLIGSLIGLPVELASAAYYWNDRDPTAIDQLVAPYVRRGEWVYADYAAFIAVKRRTRFVLIPFAVPDRFKPKVAVMILPPGAFEHYAHSLIGGEWRYTGASMVAKKRDLLRLSRLAPLMQRRLEFKIYRRIR